MPLWCYKCTRDLSYGKEHGGNEVVQSLATVRTMIHLSSSASLRWTAEDTRSTLPYAKNLELSKSPLDKYERGQNATLHGSSTTKNSALWFIQLHFPPAIIEQNVMCHGFGSKFYQWPYSVMSHQLLFCFGHYIFPYAYSSMYTIWSFVVDWA